MCLGLRVCTLIFSRDHLSNIERLSQEASRDIFVSRGIGDQTPLVPHRAAVPVELRFIALERMDVIAVEELAGLWRCWKIRLKSSLFVALGNKREKPKRERGELTERPNLLSYSQLQRSSVWGERERPVPHRQVGGEV